jgi:signal transduction histidine kinase
MAHEQGARMMSPRSDRSDQAQVVARPLRQARDAISSGLSALGGRLRALRERAQALWRRLRTDPRALHLGWLFAGINVALVLLVAIAISLTATSSLRRLASEEGLARAQGAGAVAREEVRRAGEDLRTTARLLSERPTLQRLVNEHETAALEPFLTRFCATGGADACAVFQGPQLVARAGAGLPWDELLSTTGEQGERFFANPPGLASAVIGAMATFAGRNETHVYVVRLLDERFAQRLTETVGQDVRIVSYRSFAESAIDEVERLHSAALSDGQFAVRMLGQEQSYASSFPLFASTGEAVALIETRLPADQVALSAGRLTLRLLLTALVVGLVALFAGILLGEQVVRPVRALTAAAERLGRGDLSTSMPSRGPAEVGVLARTMEQMRRSLVELTGTLRLRDAEAKAVLAGIVEGVYAVDAERRFSYLNPQAEKLLGVTAAAATGRFCGDVLKPCAQNGVRPCETPACPIVAARRSGSSQATERLALGGPHPRTMVIASAAPVDGLQVQVIRDETELESVRSARDSVLANISHEFRTPLGAQLASIELLRDGLDHMSIRETRELVLSLERGTQRLTRLIDNLLESVRIESGQLGLRRQPLVLSELLDDARGLIGAFLTQRNQTLEVSIPDDVPTFEGDGPRLTQVFVNLLANASKFAPEGSTVRVGARAVGALLTVWVEDEGAGLPDMEQASIFDRFYRGPEQEPEHDGLGLGLWIVKSIVERQGGSVAAARTPEGRTRFTIMLPLGDAA